MRAFLTFATCGLLAACGSMAVTANTPAGVTIKISPKAAALPLGATVQFAASVTLASNTAVTWSVVEPSGGSVTLDGLYKAPTLAGTFHVAATSVAAPSTSAQADVVVSGTTTPLGVWTNVTPANVDLTTALPCGNFGAHSIQVDPKRPSDLYADFSCQGIWKSTDFGVSWTGPINTGTNGPTINGEGGILIPSSSTTTPPVIYAANIRDPGTGFWRSTDGAVSWTKFFVSPSTAARQDFYPPADDPYDGNHLLMAGHEMNLLVESKDGGQTWTAVPTAAGMQQSGGTAWIVFVDTGVPATTAKTFLWLAQQGSAVHGTWRTEDAGATWTQVDRNEHPHGNSQLYQPGNGIIFMAGANSTLGWGVLRSTDYGRTWAHVGIAGSQANVVGTPNKVYSMYGWAIGLGQTNNPAFELSPQPGTGLWTAPGSPAGMTQGPNEIALTFDGFHYALVSANYNAGLWRYLEP